MLKEERFDRILAFLEENEFVTVPFLSEKLNVSTPTIRRDLAELANRNQIIRSHGGAMCVGRQDNVAPPFDFRRSVNAREKASIARAATRFLRDNSVIYIDASTSAAHLTEHLVGLPGLIVITNSLTTALGLNNRGVRTYCLGGEVLPESMAVAGPIAIEGIRNFNIDVMFFSSYGVNANGMIVDSAESENELRRHLLQLAATSVFLCDSSKFDKNAAFNLALLDKIDYMVTDRLPPDAYPAPRQGLILAQ